MIDTKEAIELFKNAPTEQLAKIAREETDSVYGKKVFLRGLIEFSNYCQLDCAYCGIRHSNKNINRYMYTDEEILNIVNAGLQHGLKTFVMQSGENHTDFNHLIHLVELVRNAVGDEVAITLSCGLFTKQQYQTLKDAGTNRYLMRFETSDEQLFAKLKNGQKLSTRLAGLDAIKSVGMELGSGYMIGLPGETLQTQIDNAILCKKLDIDMGGIGPFIPHKETPLGECKCCEIEPVIRATALLRLLNPEANIPATTAAGSITSNGREKVLLAGANVVMTNISPELHKQDYLIYPDKVCLKEDGFVAISDLRQKFASIGLELSLERGDCVKR